MEIGRNGEDFACNYLIKNGYIFHDRNVRSGKFEIDLIFFDPEGTIVFVEVKSLIQKSLFPGYLPEDQMKFRKVQNLYRAAELFLSRSSLIVKDWRIDFIGIEFRGGSVTGIRHYKNI